MKYYFQLQFKRILRTIKDFGISPIIAIIFGVILFMIGSKYLFEINEFSKYAYALFAILTAGNLAKNKRNDFIKSCFNKTDYYKIRVLENSLSILPFLLFLVYKQQFLISLILIVVVSLQAIVFSFQSKYSVIIPTPFYKKPFEFIIGFRKFWYIFALLYFILFKAIQFQNPNLGIFVLLAHFLIFISFYFKIETQFYVWIYDKSPRKFLLFKIKNAVLQSSVFIVPIFVLLIYFFPQMWYLYGAATILGNLFLATAIVGKYAYYPSELNFIQSLALIFCFIFPPILFLVFPYFYSSATKKLSYILK